MTEPTPIEKAGLARFCLPRAYPRPLPDELRPFHCYTVDGGHSIIVILTNVIPPGKDAWGYAVPAPVKTVLRAGWFMRDGLPWVSLPYDENLGLLTPDEETEY
jgi:hypothetical protein